MYRPHRRGVTLTEVLVAIFVCGLGLMALMTLFPLGAFNMSQAIEDDRCGHAGANGAAILRAVWREYVQTGGNMAAGANLLQPDGSGSGYLSLESLLKNGSPVYIDPIGKMLNGTSLPGGIPRVSLGYLQSGAMPDALKWCMLLDDIDFEPSGIPVGAGGLIQRQARYSWAWMVRWLGNPQTYIQGVPNMRALAFSVVVYHGRSLGLANSGEFQTSGQFVGINQIRVSGTNPIRKGMWLLDASNSSQGGYFYRVIRVEGTLVTVQPNLRGGGGGTLVAMDAVAAVLERTTLE